MQLDDEFPLILEVEFNPNPHNDYPPVLVGFGVYHELDDVKTVEAGHEVYRDVDFVKIVVPGDKNTMVFQPASDTHRRRFPKAYAEFKARTAGAETRQGLPIENWAPINRSVAMTLRAAHIHTVEALAVVHDSHIDRIGTNGRELRAKAIAFLEQAKDSSAVIRLAAEKKELQDQLAAMQGQINQLVQMQATTAAPELASAVAADASAARQPSRRAKAE